MLVIWRGYGWLVPILVFTGLILSQLSVNALFGDEFYKSHDWPKYVGVGLGSFFVALLGYYLNYMKRPIEFDEETGQTLRRGPSHTLFFIPIEYWAVISIALFSLAFLT